MKLIDESALAIMTIWQEARGESYEGKLAVGEVLRNRIIKRVHSDGTIIGTCLKPYQFSGYNTNDPNRIPAFRLDSEDKLVSECKKAWEESGKTSLVKGATMYYNPDVPGIKTPEWAKEEKFVTKIGHHYFYNA